MILLDATTKLLDIILTAAKTTTDMDFVASYVDINQTTFAMSAASEGDGVSNGTTAVTVVAAPGATTTRKVQFLSVWNTDTASKVLKVRVNNNGTFRVVWSGTLAVGDTFIYVDTLGFKVTDANGQIKYGFTAGPISATTGTFSGTLAVTGAISSATSVALTGATNNLGTITSGVWNAGAVTSSGLLTVNGFGTHPFSAGGNGTQNISLINTTSDAAAKSQFFLSAGTTQLLFQALSQGFTTSLYNVAASGVLYSDGAGGLSIVADNAASAIRFYSGGSSQRGKFDATGDFYTNDGTVHSLSDARTKTLLRPFTAGLDAIKAIQATLGVYCYRADLEGIDAPRSGREFVSVFAQTVQPYIPEAVGVGKDGYLTMTSSPFIYALMNATVELDGYRQDHESRLKALEERIH